MASPSTTYQPRDPAQGVLYQIVRDHFETFRAQAAALRDGDGLPRFVEDEFRDFLRCGWLAGGFARFQCVACGADRLVPFSCKGRAVCPSCGGRRMTERAGHLVDRVFPDVPVRQWVLSLPYRLRYLLAWDHALCRAVVGVYLRTVLGFLRHRARREGVRDGRGGAVAIIQRFGAALNLNVHVHALVLDGVFAKDGVDRVRFHRTPRLTSVEVAGVLATVARRIGCLLVRRGLAEADASEGATDPWAKDAPALAGIAAASVQGLVALGARAGARVRRAGDPAERVTPGAPARCHAQQHGFDLHAGLVVPAGQRGRLERVCRYTLRSPVAQDRLRVSPDGQVWLTLRHRWADGTTHLRFDPVELLERLAALTPRPRVNLILYHGVLAPRAAWRGQVVQGPGAGEAEPAAVPAAPADGDEGNAGRPGDRLWADLMQRSFGLDVLACPRCGGRMRLIALIDQASVIQRILRHLGLPTGIPALCPARAPPSLADAIHGSWGDASAVSEPCS